MNASLITAGAPSGTTPDTSPDLAAERPAGIVAARGGAASAPAAGIPAGPEPDGTELPVAGRLPVELNGVLARIAAGPAGPAPDPSCRCPEPGPGGHGHGVAFRDGRAWLCRTAPSPRLPAGPAAGTRRSHPWYEPDTGTLHWVAWAEAGPGPVEHWEQPPGGEPARRARLTLPGSPLLHALAVTRRHLVLFDLPVRYRWAAAAMGDPVPYRWRPGQGGRLVLVERASGRTRAVPVAPGFVAHLSNAYELASGCEVSGLLVVEGARMPGWSGAGPTRLWRWTVDLAAGRCRERALSCPGHEGPVVDERLHGRPHRFSYATDSRRAVLVGHDALHDRTVSRPLPDGLEVEGLLVAARSPWAAEGDGWLLVLATDAARNRGEVLVLPAGDIAGPAPVRVALPARVPAGGHPFWLAA